MGRKTIPNWDGKLSLTGTDENVQAIGRETLLTWGKSYPQLERKQPAIETKYYPK